MKKNAVTMFIVVCCLLVVRLGLAGGKAPDMAEDKPLGIVFDTLEHDFGDQVSGNLLKHTFTFKNLGTTPFSIKDVKAG